MDTLRWRKSTYSDNQGTCVEVALLPDGGAFVRDTKDRAGGTQTYNPAEWTAFVAGVKAGEFDPA